MSGFGRTLWFMLIGSAAWAVAAEPAFEQADPAQMFQVLYGPQAVQVAGTPDTSDDLRFARQILEAARNPKTSPTFREILCLKAHEFALRNIEDGPKLAIEAIEYLIRQDPQSREDHLPELRQAYEAWRRTSGGSDRLLAQQGLVKILIEEADRKIENGSEVEDLTESVRLYEQASSIASALGQSASDRAAIRQRIADANRQLTVLRRIALARTRLKSSPKDESAGRDLLMMYIVELDHPREARKYTFLTSDAGLQARVLAASNRPSNLRREEMVEVAVWYGDLAVRATGDARWAMYRRAELYYDAYLRNSPPDQDVAARSELERIRAMLKKATSTAEAQPRF